MKRVAFFTAFAATLLAGGNAYGQDLFLRFSNGKYGAVDRNGKEVVPCKYDEAGALKEMKNVSALFSVFAKSYVEQKINAWQLKGEFETTAQWQQRVTESTRRDMIKKYAEEAEQKFIAEATSKMTVNLSLGTYSADSKTFPITSNISSGTMLVYVPLEKAPNFKASWSSIKYTPQFGIENDRIALAAIDFKLPNGESYRYSNRETLTHVTPKIDYKFNAPIEVNVADNSSYPKGKQTVTTASVSVGTSEVDVNIPATGANKNVKTFAVIIANENYLEAGVSQVDFALNDGETFKKYCIQTLGLPEENVSYRANATLNNISREVDWLRTVAEKYKGDIKIIFYYAGHGISDEGTRVSYLLPVDGYGTNVKSAYKLDDLYRELGSIPAKSVVVFMDACFSGAARDEKKMVASTRGVAIKAIPGAPVGNMVVFASSQSDETSLPYRAKGHGMFTYFLLKKLQESKGNVTLVELESYLSTNVGQQSVRINRKGQTPTAKPSSKLGFAWEDWKLR